MTSMTVFLQRSRTDPPEHQRQPERQAAGIDLCDPEHGHSRQLVPCPTPWTSEEKSHADGIAAKLDAKYPGQRRPASSATSSSASAPPTRSTSTNRRTTTGVRWAKTRPDPTYVTKAATPSSTPSATSCTAADSQRPRSSWPIRRWSMSARKPPINSLKWPPKPPAGAPGFQNADNGSNWDGGSWLRQHPP